MIARHRGDVRLRSRWRPSTPVPAATATENDDIVSPQPDELLDARRGLDLRSTSWRKPRALIALATIAVVAVIAGQQRSLPSSAAAHLSLTPRQWVDQWTAAALQSPAVVCNHLYAPTLTHAFSGDTGHSCTWYYASVRSTSFRIRHVLQDGAGAAVEAEAVGARRRSGNFTMLLSHIDGGWQAVDVVPGGPVPAR